MDVCVVTFRNSADRVRPALRPGDRLWVRDNTDDNIGFGRAANQLAALGGQPLILFINPDGDARPGCLDALEACFADREVVAAEAAQGGESSHWQGERLTWLSGACLAVRRAAFELAGGFDPRLFLYCEDVDLSWRLAELGRLVHCAEAVFDHDRHPRSWRRLYRQWRSALAVNAWHGRPAGRQALEECLGNLARCHPVIGSAQLVALAAHTFKPLR